METIQSLIESSLSTREAVKVVLPLTVRTKPEYTGAKAVKLRVDYARGNGWKV